MNTNRHFSDPLLASAVASHDPSGRSRVSTSLNAPGHRASVLPVSAARENSATPMRHEGAGSDARLDHPLHRLFRFL
jgi:hypothetical protein